MSGQHDTPPGRFVRMASLREVEALLSNRVSALPPEQIELSAANGRILAENIASAYAIPQFDRSAMDGYAIRSVDVATVTSESPRTLRTIGSSFPNRPCSQGLQTGETIRITTGAPLPSGADAVIKQEQVEVVDSEIIIREPIVAGKNVGRRGEDISAGELLLSPGRTLRPQDLGVLSSIGHAQLQVIRHPRVKIFVTGNEILPAGSQPTGYQVVDSSSVMLLGLVGRDGGIVIATEYLPDDPVSIRRALENADADCILVTGGTSVGGEDFAPQVLAEVGELLVHGMQIRPAKPIGIGFIGKRAVFLLPGNPLSCLCAYDLVVRRAIQQLGGRRVELPYRKVILPLGERIGSAVDRVDYIRITVTGGVASPLKNRAGTGASTLSAATRADGFLIVPEGAAEMPAGTLANIFLYD